MWGRKSESVEVRDTGESVGQDRVTKRKDLRKVFSSRKDNRDGVHQVQEY